MKEERGARDLGSRRRRFPWARWRDQAEAETAELRAELAEVRAELATALATIVRLDDANAARLAEVDRYRRTLLCIALLAEEDRTVDRWITDARDNVTTIRPAHRSA